MIARQYGWQLLITSLLIVCLNVNIGYGADLTCVDISTAVNPTNAYAYPGMDQKHHVEYCDTATWYAIDLKADHTYTIVLDAHLNSGELDFVLYESDGETIVTRSADIRIYDGETGAVDKRIGRSGTYYLEVTQYDGDVTTGGYDLAIYNAWHNPDITDASRSFYNTIHTARYIADGTYSADYMNAYPHYHYYRFVAQEGTPVEVSVTSHIGGGWIDFGIFTSDEREIVGSDDIYIYDGETGTASASYLVDGVYIVRVWGSVIGTYDLTITGAVVDSDTDGDGLFDAAEYYRGTNVDEADTDGDGTSDLAELQAGLNPIAATEFNTAQVDAAADALNALQLPGLDNLVHAEYNNASTWYAIDLKADHTYTIVLDAHLNSGELDFVLYESDGETIVTRSADIRIYDGETGAVDKRIGRSGTYYLEVTQYDGDVTTGGYDLAIYNAWHNPDITDASRSFYNTIHTARYIADGTYSADYMNAYPHYHYYRFVAQEGTPVEVSVTSHIGGGWIDFGIFTSDEREIVGSDDIYIYDGETGTASARIWLMAYTLYVCGVP